MATSGRELELSAKSPLLSENEDGQVDTGNETDDVVVQFAVQIFFVEEDEGHADIGLMRLGPGDRPARVKFETKSVSAKPGEQYVETTGEVEFGAGVYHQHIRIPMIENNMWHATTEFKVRLFAPEGCQLGRYLHTARVKIIDNEAFPTNKYADQVRGEGAKERIEKMNGWGLFMEYIKLNIKQPGMFWRTLLIIIFDQLKNVNTLMKTFLLKYMVDVVFNIRDPNSIEKLWICKTRKAEAYLIAAVFVVAIIVLHIWEYFKIKLDVKGISTGFLRSNLIRKYMNYSDDSRRQVDQARLQVAMLEDVDEMSSGYQAILNMAQIIGKVALLGWFTLTNNVRGWWVVVLMPTCMFLFVFSRFAILPSPPDSLPAKQAVLHLVNEIAKNYELIVNYYQRPKINEMMMKRVQKLRDDEIPERAHELGDEYFPHWLGSIFLGVYVYLEAHLLLGNYETQTLSLGVFLATIAVIEELGDAFEEFHEVLLTVDHSFAPMKELTFFLNLPTDLREWKAVNRRRREWSKDRREAFRGRVEKGEVDLGGKFLEDMITIELKDVHFAFSPQQPVFRAVSLEVDQGKLVAIYGEHQTGKTTFLQLLGHALFPTMGIVFVPGHLRLIQVSQGIMLFETWSLWDNLTFGLQKDDVDPSRIEYILKKMKMEKTLSLIQGDIASREVPADAIAVRMPSSSSSEELEVHEGKQSWHELLSMSEKAKLHVARAFVTNAEVLIMDSPLANFGPEASREVMETLREHLANRGLGLPEGSARLRRPRTCFYTVEEEDDAEWAEVVWELKNSTAIVKRDSAKESNKPVDSPAAVPTNTRGKDAPKERPPKTGRLLGFGR